jgi:hypothetical protein
MTQGSFDEDLRFCTDCRRYVRYLRSPMQSYCTECGAAVRIYSPEDMAEFKKATRHEEVLTSRLRAWDGDDPRAVS